MSIVKLVAGIAVEAVKLGVEAAAKHSRKLTKRQLKEDFVRAVLATHMAGVDGACVQCGKRAADSSERCPGTPAQQRARDELARGDYELHAERKGKP